MHYKTLIIMTNVVIGDIEDMDLPNSINWSNPFSLREKARMRGSNKINRFIAIDHLTLTLSCKERGLLRHPPGGEGGNGTAVS